MSQQSTLEITDRHGWRKEFPLTKTITTIGSDPRNDIVLENWRGTGVASRHLQLICSAGDPSGQEYRLVNLGDTDVLLGSTGAGVSPRSTAAVTSGQHIRLGDFEVVLNAAQTSVDTRLPEPQQSVSQANGLNLGVPVRTPEPTFDIRTFSAGQPAAGARTSESIGAGLSLAGTRLSPDQPLVGSVTVRNRGAMQGVQFKIEVAGVDPDIYEVGPAPVLFPGAEKAIALRLRHSRRPTPLAGEYELCIRVTAPDAYPGEYAMVTQTIEILPFRHHTLRILSQAD